MKVKFVPQGVEAEIKSNQSILDLAKEVGVNIKSVCGGVPSCAECLVQIKEGEYNVPAPSNKELALIGTAHYIDRSRLACQLKCFGDVVIDLNQQIEKQTRPLSTKKPRSSSRKENTTDGIAAEEEPSHAIMGNIMLEGSDEELPVIGPNQEDINERRAAEFMAQDERRKLREKGKRDAKARSQQPAPQPFTPQPSTSTQPAQNIPATKAKPVALDEDETDFNEEELLKKKHKFYSDFFEENPFQDPSLTDDQKKKE